MDEDVENKYMLPACKSISIVTAEHTQHHRFDK
jgi:hypothetical protein